MKKLLILFLFFSSLPFFGQTDQKIYDIIDTFSANTLKNDVKTLVDFGTRNTFSDTLSKTRGIGAARRWIASEFQKISRDCNNCLEVFYQKNWVTKKGNRRVPKDAWVTNVVAIQRGTKYPNRYIMMSGDIDSRASNDQNITIDAPGANDNASGMAGTIEAARVLSKYKFESSIVYVGLSGEEQGLFGGIGLAKYAKEHNWDVVSFFNNDMIGNIEGVDGVIDNRTFRIFSEPVPVTETDRQRNMRRYYGGEVDGISRQLARYVYKTTKTYMPEMNPMLVYRLDRFGRGGHHKPFNDLGYAAIRIMEAHENYTQQHQDIRIENGIHYGDTFEHVNAGYATKIATVNAIAMANLAWAPPAPNNVTIGGGVQAAAKLKWDAVEGAKAYKIYWRDTASPTWDHSRYVEATDFIMKGFVVDNFFFGVAAVGKNGHESIVTFPSKIMR